MAERNIRVGNIQNVSGEVNVAGRDLYKGYTPEQVSVLLTKIQSTFQPRPFDGRCPYKGLDAFEERDAALFFGRERAVRDVLRRLTYARAVFLTGPSGSGKSSLARAGVIPALKQGALTQLKSEAWLYETLTPGVDPLSQLARVVSSLAGTLWAGEELQARGAGDPSIFARWCEVALGDAAERRALILVDQFEEVFTYTGREEERQALLRLLTHAASVQNGRVIVLFAMRSDFVSNCAAYPALNAMLNQPLAFAQIGSMQPEELVSAIAQPALRVGLRIDPDLVAQIINDMEGEPGALPLMQFALKDLFDSQQEKGGVLALSLEDYLERGGIRRSLQRHADHILTTLTEPEQVLAQSVFSGLIEVGRGTQDTRRTALLEEVVPAHAQDTQVRSIVQKLASARLITTDEQAGKDVLTISHEKLIDAWPWLRNLINENREVIALQNEIASDAREWEEHQKDPSYLYHGARLANVREKLEAKKLALNHLSQAFIQAGIGVEDAGRREQEARRRKELRDARRLAEAEAQRAEEQTRSASRLRQLARYLILALAIALVAAGAAVFFGFLSRQQATDAYAGQLAAQAKSMSATTGSKQMMAVLLAIRSMQIRETSDAAQVLVNSTLARPVFRMPHDFNVSSVDFSPDGRYVVSTDFTTIARVWEAATGRELTTLAHNAEVRLAEFGPDGRYLATGSADGFVRIWALPSGNEVMRLTHPAGVSNLAFSSDGEYLVSSSLNTIYVWHLDSGEELTRLVHTGTVHVLAVSTDGRYVASGASDNLARVWEIATGREVSHLLFSAGVDAVAFSPDGAYVISSSYADLTARVWEVATGKEVGRVTHSTNSSTIFTRSFVAFSPDGKYVASGYGGDRFAYIWDPVTGKEVARLRHDGGIMSLSFSPDNRSLLAASLDGTARVWDLLTGSEVARMTHDGPLRSAAFSPDGRYIVSGGEDDYARVWEVSVDRRITNLSYEQPVSRLLFSPDGNYLLASSGNQGAPIWEVATGKEVMRLVQQYPASVFAFTGDGRYAVSGSYDGTVRVWQVSSGREMTLMLHEDRVSAVAFSPDGHYVASTSDDMTARVWEVLTGKEVVRLLHGDRVSSVAFSPDGKFVVSASNDQTARVWETVTGREIARMHHDVAVIEAAFSPDGNYVVSSDNGGDIRIWEAATGTEVTRMRHGPAAVSAVFSPDGRYVVSSSYFEVTARVWEAATGKAVASMTHENAVRSVAFSPDGRYVISGSGDGTARVWEASSGKEIVRMTHESPVNSVAFSPEGRYAASSGEDHMVRIWLWRPADLVANLCAHLPRNLTRLEWKQYLGDAPYEAVCPELPLEPEPTTVPTFVTTPLTSPATTP